MTNIVIVSLILGGLSFAPAWAEEKMSPDSGKARAPLQEFFELKEKLPQVICDQDSISRAPTLGSTFGPNVDSSARTGQTESISDRYWVEINLAESKLISFLMGDPWAWSEDKEQRKRISLEICKALVIPDALSGLFSKNRNWFLELRGKNPKLRSGNLLFELHDLEGRVGKIQGAFYMPGWIESYEVVQVWVPATTQRIYRRLAHPVTNDGLFVVLSTTDGIPLGYFSPTKQSIQQDRSKLLAQAQTPESFKKRIEIYRLLIETEAYQELKKNPSQTENMRKIQEFYKNLVHAYEIFPDDNRFKGLSGKSVAGGASLGPAVLEQIFDPSFFLALNQALINQAHVEFHYLPPDPKLHGIYKEYLQRMQKELGAAPGR